MAPLPESVPAFREAYRREHVPARYHGARHLAFTFGVGSAVLALCIANLRGVAGWEWITVPLSALYVNLAEYWGHRGPMHHLTRGLRLVYERHTRQHHRFFTHETMPIDGSRDFRAVLFPPVLMIFFLLAFAVPAGLLLATIATENVAWLFVATSIVYFLNYEFLHLAYHLPPAHPVARLPLIGRLKRLHTAHHDPRLMASRNFNITYPLGDWLFGTLHR